MKAHSTPQKKGSMELNLAVWAGNDSDAKQTCVVNVLSSGQKQARSLFQSDLRIPASLQVGISAGSPSSPLARLNCTGKAFDPVSPGSRSIRIS